MYFCPKIDTNLLIAYKQSNFCFYLSRRFGKQNSLLGLIITNNYL
jgi:hypothetical protein